jgi:AraC-like DNA-binding protein
MLESTVATPYIRHLLTAAQSLGADGARALRQADIAPATLDDPDARVVLAAHDRLWWHLSSQLGREQLEFAAGARFAPEALGIAGHVVSSCADAGEAMVAFARYRSLIGGDQIVPRLIVTNEYIELRYAPLDPAFADQAHSGESGLLSMLMAVRSLGGVRCDPLEIWFQHRRPPSLARYAEYFSCPTYFAKPYRRLRLPRAVGELKLVRGNQALRHYLARHADALLQQLVPERSVADRVREQLVASLARAEQHEDLIARRIGLSARTLQRHLRHEGVSFVQLLDEVRHRLALRYLDDRAIAVAEIAFLLGYAEPSAFFRAFRRWTGTTPRALRRVAPNAT